MNDEERPSGPTLWDRMEERLQRIVEQDVVTILTKNRAYGESWKKRGGIGAFMMLARKWDRLEEALKVPPDVELGDHCWFDLFAKAVTEETSNAHCDERLLETIRDLRCYLLLVEDEVMELVAKARAKTG